MKHPCAGYRRLPLKGATPVALQSRFHGVSRLALWSGVDVCNG